MLFNGDMPYIHIVHDISDGFYLFFWMRCWWYNGAATSKFQGPGFNPVCTGVSVVSLKWKSDGLVVKSYGY